MLLLLLVLTLAMAAAAAVGEAAAEVQRLRGGCGARLQSSLDGELPLQMMRAHHESLQQGL